MTNLTALDQAVREVTKGISLSLTVPCNRGKFKKPAGEGYDFRRGDLSPPMFPLPVGREIGPQQGGGLWLGEFQASAHRSEAFGCGFEFLHGAEPVKNP